MAPSFQQMSEPMCHILTEAFDIMQTIFSANEISKYTVINQS